MCTAGIDRRRGFTLLELLVVLVIASLAVSLVGPAFQRFLPGLTLEVESRKLESLLRHARSQAILSGTRVAISQDVDSGGLLLSYRDEPYRLPERFSLQLQGGPGGGEPFVSGAQILFYPRGDSSGGSLSLSLELGRSEDIAVDWLSGRVRRVSPDESEDPPRQRARQQEDEGEADE
ncbi:GspH/FimT family pseudopilin [Pseudomonas zhanjiangensis]|uniref:Type II secretion system protein H n=1 Tax=Pseudomonas zhanjiangensis TaxID=3239015 RepID=A0ABV3YN65_9PSED